MTCAEFESALAELLSSPGAGDSDLRWTELRAHAVSCRECAGSIDLLALAAVPAAERDPIQDPGPGYWRSFDAALARRIDGERRSRLLLRIVAAAAAVVGVVLIGRALFRHEPPAPVASGAGAARPPIPAPVTPRLSPSRSETAPALGSLDEPLDPDDDALGTLGGAGALDAFTTDAPGGILPDVDALSPDQTRRLLDWLREEEARLKKGDA